VVHNTTILYYKIICFRIVVSTQNIIRQAIWIYSTVNCYNSSHKKLWCIITYLLSMVPLLYEVLCINGKLIKNAKKLNISVHTSALVKSFNLKLLTCHSLVQYLYLWHCSLISQTVWAFRLLQHCWWGNISSRLWYCINGWWIPHILRQHNGLTFKGWSVWEDIFCRKQTVSPL